MAIIIPSKNIYEINDNKVIDNEVDKIENTIVEVQTIRELDKPVYTDNNAYANGEKINYQNKSNEDSQAKIVNLGEGSQDYGYIASAYAEFGKRSYIVITLLIPKYQKDKVVERIRDKDEKGNSLISIKNYGDIYTSTVTQDWTIEVKWNDYWGGTPNAKITEKGMLYDTNTEYKSNVPDIDIISHLRAVANITWVSATVDITNDLPNNISEVQLAENNRYKIVIEMPIGSYGYTLKAIDSVLSPLKDGNYTVTATGNYTSTNIRRIEISVNGDIYSVDISDKDIVVGNGEHIYSFDGNELMQTTNTPTVENIYQEVIDDWKQGKETATLRCAITDYGNAKITIVNSMVTSGGYDCFFYSNYPFKPNDKIYYEEYVYTVNSFSGDNGRLFAPFGTELFYNKEIVVKVNDFEKTVFKWDDIVEPYVYGVHGKDKPMATYKDGTPKHFKVTGVHIIADGGIYQDIDIQEIRQ